MPVSLSIKGVPDDLAAGLRARALANHRSLQRELMAIIEVAAANPTAYHGRDATRATSMEPHGEARRKASEMRSIEQVVDELRALFPRARSRGPSSTQIIREMRDGRYGALNDRNGRKLRSG